MFYATYLSIVALFMRVMGFCASSFEDFNEVMASAGKNLLILTEGGMMQGFENR